MITILNRLTAVILLLLGAYITSKAQIESSIPETHLNLPVLVSIQTTRGNSTSSGFIIADKEWWYLVTAKHVLFAKDSIHLKDTLIGKSATIRIPDSNTEDTSVSVVLMNLDVIQSDKRILHHKTADVAMIRIGKYNLTNLHTLVGAKFISLSHNAIQARSLEMLAKYSEIKIGNNIYVYGYPTSIGLVAMPKFDYSRPLLRKGIIAGKNDYTRTIILDCPVYYGNSGCPVIQESPDGLKSKYKIIGIVTEWIPFDESKANGSSVPQGALYTNSGYAVCESIDRIFEILL